MPSPGEPFGKEAEICQLRCHDHRVCACLTSGFEWPRSTGETRCKRFTRMFHEVLPNLCRSLGLGDGSKDDTEAVIMERVRVGSMGCGG